MSFLNLFKPAASQFKFSRGAPLFGWPDIHWEAITMPSQFVLHPQAFSFGQVQWIYFLAVNAERGTVARQSGGDHFMVWTKERILRDAMDYAASVFGAQAKSAREAWSRQLAHDVMARNAETLRVSEYEARRKEEQQQRQEQERKRAVAKSKVSRPIPLSIAGNASGVVLGTEIEFGDDLVVPVMSMQHMLIAGTTGSGKSVFSHQVIWQLVRSPQVERLILIDLKGGVEFDRYRDSAKVQVIWEYVDVITVVDGLVQLMAERQTHMRENRLQNWPNGRVFVVIDEYAELQSDMDAANTPDEKRTAKLLAGNLVRIARRARSLGIVLVCALQKPTTDAMDSALRTNLNLRICLRVGSRSLASSVLDGLDDAPADPVSLQTGRFVYYDASTGRQLVAQTQIAPGVEIGVSK